MRPVRWIVLEPPADERTDGVTVPPSEKARFLKDRFSPLAFFLTFLWLFWHRLWLPGLLVLGLDIGLYVLMAGSDLELLSSAIQIGLALLIGLEGRNLVAGRMRRRGWRETGVIHAGKLSEAEAIYYGRLSPMPQSAGITPSTRIAPAPVTPPVALPWTAPKPPAAPVSA